ncbi:uncharacterized protein LOC133305142 [Gastrolobium bilobum]|uniref:uncharacterized protein LOC133305142 n=1 Tax=Gastrolobium bilobum TaxID=150636 RepID=UPI002AB31076|nr:uncharacterized protein LOC133305142 [Gastrolobium bilobum]
MNKAFEDQLGKNVEVYIDDMIVKSFDLMKHVQDLKHTFQKLRKYRIRLNPVKCVFGVPSEKLLGFMLTHRGIEANLDKCKAKEAIEGWNPACQAAFKKVKKCLATPPVLSKPNPGDILILYLAVEEEAISAVLIKETSEGQESIYFISRALEGAEVKYQKLEKVAFALLIAARRLRPYFQGHQIIVQQNITMPIFVLLITSAQDWRKPIVDYLEKGMLPEERLESRKLVPYATQYTIVHSQMFRKGLHVPMLKCLNSEEAEYVLAEIHERINGHHMGGKALAKKALRAGYYWPTMQADSKEHVKRCDSCQKHAKLILSPPFKAAEGQLKWLIIEVDYFTKWIEAEPVTTITSARVQRFFERNIISRFRIPAEVITDN